MKKRDHRAFTLAEVLITLVIIGVIAALTIPTLLQNKEKQEVVSGLQEANAILGSVVSRAKIDHGDISTWDFTLYSSDFAKQYITPYLKVVKNCGDVVGVQTGTCFSGANGSWYDLAGVSAKTFAGGYTSSYFYQFVLDNGMAVGVWRHVPNFNFAIIAVDVNGPKGPSRIGKDVFYFSIAQNVGFSMGLSVQVGAVASPVQKSLSTANLLNASTSSGCNKAGPATANFYHLGAACGLIILRDGWKISDTYPWD